MHNFFELGRGNVFVNTVNVVQNGLHTGSDDDGSTGNNLTCSVLTQLRGTGESETFVLAGEIESLSDMYPQSDNGGGADIDGGHEADGRLTMMGLV